MQFAFIVRVAEDYQSILNISCRPPAFTSFKAFLKENKNRSGTSRSGSFSVVYDFEDMKIFLLLYSIT